MIREKTLPMTANMQNYLVEILELGETHGHAHTGEIAARLNVRMPSVTHALKTLNRLGFLIYNPNAPVLLTESGRELAARLRYFRRTITLFFEFILQVSPEESSCCACALEHSINIRAVKALDFLTNEILSRPDYKTLREDLQNSLFLENDLVKPK